MALPSIAQMKNRAQWPHRLLLNSFGADGEACGVKMNGRPTARKTLLRWGCIEVIPGKRDPQFDVIAYRLTERGVQLRSALN